MSQPKIQPFQMNISTDGFRVCSVYSAINSAIPMNVNAILSFSTPLTDPDGWYSVGSPTRLTVPSGVSVARFTATFWLYTLGLTSSWPFYVARLKKNGVVTGYIGQGRGEGDGGSVPTYDETILLLTPWISVTPGDYFEIEFFHQFTSASTVDAQEIAFTAEYLKTTFTNKGALWAWGNNQYGQLGDGTVVSKSSPIRIGTLTDWVDIRSDDGTVTDGKAVAIRDDGTIYGWGENSYGNIGNGTVTNKSSPVQIGALTTWKFVTENDQSAYAIKTDGSLWAWGQNTNGALGTGTLTNYSSPIQIGSLTNWAMVAGGINYTLALKTDGSMWSWGYNNVGQLGLGNTVSYSSPVRIGTSTDWKFIDAGDTACAAIKTDGSLWTWADNTYGALGIGSTASKSSPTRVGSDTNWINVNICRSMALGIKS